MNWKSTQVRAGLVVVLGTLIMGITVWKTYPSTGKRVLLDISKAKYMHCPECEAESSFALDKLDKACLQCGYDKSEMTPTQESIKKVAQKSPYGKMVAFLLPELVVFLGALWFVLKPKEGGGGEEFRYMRCPNCNAKLRYRAAQVGAPGACSKCKRAFRFPEGTPTERELDGADKYQELEVDD